MANMRHRSLVRVQIEEDGKVVRELQIDWASWTYSERPDKFVSFDVSGALHREDEE